MLKQLTVIRRNEKPASLAVWLYPLYPVQESSFAINQPFAEWLPFPLQVLLGCPQEQCAGGQMVPAAAIPSQLWRRCMSRLPCANSATRKCKVVFLQGCYAEQGGEEGALNELYFLGIIVRKTLSFGGSQSLQKSFFCLRLSSSGEICLAQVRKCLWSSTCLWGAQWLERKKEIVLCSFQSSS